MLLRTDVPMPELEGQRNLPFVSGVAISANFNEIQLRREDVIMGVTIVSAQLVVRPDPGGTPEFTKSITTTAGADGEVTDDGATGVAACRFDLSSGELTATVPRVFLVTITDTLGRVTDYDSGYLAPILAAPPETAVAHVVISPVEKLNVPLGQTVQMGAAAYDAGNLVLPGRVITYSSSDVLVATVNAIGTVTTVGLGSVVITASSGGKQAHAQLSVIADIVLLATFTDADATNLHGWACDTGQVGVVQTEAWEIDGNAACCTTSVTRAFVVWETGVADCTLSVTLVVIDPTDLGGLWFRSTDSLNGFLAVADDTVYHLYRREAGAYTSLGTGGSPANGDILSVVAVGSGISVRANGVEVIASTDAFNATATKHGLTAANINHRFDNLRVLV